MPIFMTEAHSAFTINGRPTEEDGHTEIFFPKTAFRRDITYTV